MMSNMIKNQEGQTENRFKCDMAHYLRAWIGKCIPVFVVLVLLVNINPVSALDNNCEQLAKEYQRVHGGDLILVQPLKDNGAYDLGHFKGHWMNKAWNSEAGNYYYNPSEKELYSQGNPDVVKRDFELKWNKQVKVLNYNKGEVPFALIFHY